MQIITTDPRVEIGVNQLVRGTPESAALDISVWPKEPIWLKPDVPVLFPTGFKMDIGTPEFAAMLYSRSGTGVKNGINVAQGVGIIDADYQGEVFVALVCSHHGTKGKDDDGILVQAGDRVAQMVFHNVGWRPELHVVGEFGRSTARGDGGFGSTG